MKNQLKKVRHLWTIICQSSVIDSLTNNISINNILEEIYINKQDSSGNKIAIQKGDIMPINFQIICFWKKLIDVNDDLFIDGKIQFIDPNGEIITENPFPIPMEKGKQRMRAIMDIKGGLKITVPGEYIFRLRAREDNKSDFIDINDSYLLIDFTS